MGHLESKGHFGSWDDNLQHAYNTELRLTGFFDHLGFPFSPILLNAYVGDPVAEVLGIPAARVRTVVADTTSIGFTHVTGGSHVTFATGMAATQLPRGWWRS
jgi:hypothetical protein